LAMCITTLRGLVDVARTYIGARVYLKGLTLKKNQLGWSTPLVSNIVIKLILFVVYKQSSRILIGSDVSQRFSMRCSV
jgi:hypothetical protein